MGLNLSINLELVVLKLALVIKPDRHFFIFFFTCPEKNPGAYYLVKDKYPYIDTNKIAILSSNDCPRSFGDIQSRNCNLCKGGRERVAYTGKEQHRMTTLTVLTLLYTLLSHVLARAPPHLVGAYFLSNSRRSIDRKYISLLLLLYTNP